MSIISSLVTAFGSGQSSRRSGTRPRRGFRASLEMLEIRSMMAGDTSTADPSMPMEQSTSPADDLAAEVGAAIESSAQEVSPVLMVISNQDFWYQDYADTRAALEARGLAVVVASTSTDVAQPHHNSGQGADGGFVTPDLALTDVEAEDYSGIVFSGGWGMAQYQYGFEGTYDNSTYNGDDATKDLMNRLIGDFHQQDKVVGAVCYGVSVLAYAEVGGEGLLDGRTVTGWNGGAPSVDGLWQNSRAQIESTGAHMTLEGSVGDPSTSHDDVIVDGNIITAQDFRAAAHFGDVIATEVLAKAQADSGGGDSGDDDSGDGGSGASGDNGSSSGDSNSDDSNGGDANTDDSSQPLPVLMVIANQDFYHREYYETRESLEMAGLQVVIAAATTETAVPHAISVVEGREPLVDPDIALADVNAEDYSTIVFVGGYGAASYQYANEVTYDNPAYQGSDDVQLIVNNLINDFVEQDKYITAICNGVTVLAWARVDGASPLDGRQVASWAHNLPSADGGVPQFTRSQIEANGGIQFASGSIGDSPTAEDDVWVDGNIITGENFDSAYAFGATIADRLLS